MSMSKHIFWGIIVLTVSFLGAYVGLTVSGYPKAADSVVSAAFVLLFFVFVSLWI